MSKVKVDVADGDVFIVTTMGTIWQYRDTSVRAVVEDGKVSVGSWRTSSPTNLPSIPTPAVVAWIESLGGTVVHVAPEPECPVVVVTHAVFCQEIIVTMGTLEHCKNVVVPSAGQRIVRLQFGEGGK